MKILVVDDEKLLVKGIKFNLENEGYSVDACYDGETAVQMAASGEYSLIILDLMMPGLDGLEACQKIRAFSTVPIIMLTARSEDADKLLGFESGADDYITKPFNILELKARIRALLRRASMPAAGPSASVIERGGLEIDTDKRAARWTSPPGSSTSSSSSLKIPDVFTAGTTSSTSSGAMTTRATSAPWTSISAACVRRSRTTPPRPG